jgi:hypothetical protein
MLKKGKPLNNRWASGRIESMSARVMLSLILNRLDEVLLDK